MLNSDTIVTQRSWYKVARVEDFPANGGACIKVKDQQIAVFHFSRNNEWYASQHLCPHRQQMGLARGMIGDIQGEPKVACPFHKQTFSLKSGTCLSSDEYQIQVYPVKVEKGFVYVGLEE
ncbi:nitrite reductase small subunit NirD [Rapidithrix thailandica]|uniref:Nitrite reductase small subunit NirD n=1 Tax=Rapidithrix thailandica TaxID=413964 RepID=A0AAW9SCJ6_9BACT